jgi:hypothetical protein
VFSPAPVTCRPNTTLQFGRNDWKSSALRVELESPTWRGAHAPTVPPRRQPEVGETRPTPLPRAAPGGEGEAAPYSPCMRSPMDAALLACAGGCGQDPSSRGCRCPCLARAPGATAAAPTLAWSSSLTAEERSADRPPPPSSAPACAKGKRRKRGDATLRPARSALDMEPLSSLRGRRSTPVCSLAPVDEPREEEHAPPSTVPDLRLCSTAASGDSVRRNVPGSSAASPPWLTSMDAAVDEEGGRRCGCDLRMQLSSVAEEPRRWRAARRRSSP